MFTVLLRYSTSVPLQSQSYTPSDNVTAPSVQDDAKLFPGPHISAL